MSSNIWLPLVLLLGFVGAAQAQPLPGPAPFRPPAATVANPGTEAAATLREGIDELLGFLGRKEKPNKLQLAAFLDGTIAPYFDFDYMAKWVFGRTYADRREEQRKALAAKLEARFLSALSGRLASYQGQGVRYLRPRRGARGSVKVPVMVMRPGSYPSKLEFHMYRSGERWRVYDVVANGQSAVAFYRRQSQQPQRGNPRGPYAR